MKLSFIIPISMVFLFWTDIAVAQRIPCSSRDTADNCLLCNCYHESRGEELDGKIAVTKVVLSRVQSPSFPNTVCGVIYQRSQFSWTPTSPPINARRPEDKAALRECRAAVQVAKTQGPNGVLYFVNPETGLMGWTRRLKRCGMIDRHLFLTAKNIPCPSSLGSSDPSTDENPTTSGLQSSDRPTRRGQFNSGLNRSERPVPKGEDDSETENSGLSRSERPARKRVVDDSTLESSDRPAPRPGSARPAKKPSGGVR